MADVFFYKVDPDAPEQGPIDAKSLKQLAANGELSPDSVLRRGRGDWVAAASVKGLEFAPAAATAYPEAIPVSPPAGIVPAAAAPVGQPRGFTLPGVVPPKAAPEGPGQIGSLNFGNKTGKASPAAKPILDLPQGFGEPKRDAAGKPPLAVPVQEPVKRPEAASPAMTLPPKVLSQETPPQETPSKEMPTGPAETAPAEPQAASSNPFASEPSARPARPGRGGGLGALFSFDTLIGPTVIKTLFYLGMAAIFLGWAGFSVFMIITALAAGDTIAIVSALFASGMMLIPAFFYVVMVRVTTEMVIIFFQIHDDVRDMRELMENRPE